MKVQLILRKRGGGTFTTVHEVTPQFDIFVRDLVKTHGRKNIQLVRIND